MTTKNDVRNFARFVIGIASVVALVALFRAPTTAFAEGKKYAVLIGVDDYSDSMVRSLNYCSKDVKELSDVLKSVGFDEIIMLDSKENDPNLKPTRANILAKIQEICEKTARDDVFFVSFSGHGVTLMTKQGDDGAAYLCPSDVKLTNLAATAAPVAEIVNALKQSEATKKLFVVDACRDIPELARSIANSVDGATRGMIAASDLTPEGKVNSELGVASAQAAGLIVIQSCAVGETSLENHKLGHGVFSNFLIESFKFKPESAGYCRRADRDSNGVVTALELYQYLDEATERFLAESGVRVHSNTVHFTVYDGRDFTLVTSTDRPTFVDGIIYDYAADRGRSRWSEWSERFSVIDGFDAPDEELPFTLTCAVTKDGGRGTLVLEDEWGRRLTLDLVGDGSPCVVVRKPDGDKSKFDVRGAGSVKDKKVRERIKEDKRIDFSVLSRVEIQFTGGGEIQELKITCDE